jgi:hypothetical protein
MRFYKSAACVMLIASATFPAMAAKGSYSNALRKILTQTVAGSCAADIMAPKLLNACHEQMSRLQPGLAALGPIKSITFVRADMHKGERMETYKVAFAKGESAL